MNVVQWVDYVALNRTNSFSLSLLNKSPTYWAQRISISLLKLLVFSFFIWEREISTNGNALSVNLSRLTYHNLDSRPWASRRRRGRSGWKGCTGRTKRHKKRRRCRLSDETATWKKRGSDISHVLRRSSIIDILTLGPRLQSKNPCDWSVQFLQFLPSHQETLKHIFHWNVCNCGEQPCIQTQSQRTRGSCQIGEHQGLELKTSGQVRDKMSYFNISSTRFFLYTGKVEMHRSRGAGILQEKSQATWHRLRVFRNCPRDNSRKGNLSSQQDFKVLWNFF